MPSIRDAVRMGNLFAITGKSKRIINVINRDHEYHEGALTKSEYERALGHKVSHVIGFDTKYAMDAINMGKPVAQTEGALSQGVRKLVDDLVGAPSIVEENNDSFWAKLFK
jgi:Flp pilus assembly CpaE family ATPase